MENVPVEGKQARMMNTLGKRVAAATRDGTATNLQAQTALPPEMIPHPHPKGTKRDGQPVMQFGDRLMGANSIALRMDAAARGTVDTRYGTAGRAQWCNREHGERQDPVRGENPVTKQLPKPVEMASHRTTPVQNVHREDAQAFGPGGEAAGLVEVKAGSPIYDKEGTQAKDFHELRDTYEVYHCSELNAAGVTARTPPNGSQRAIDAQDAAFADQCKAAGAAARKPDEPERIGLVVGDEQEKLKRDLREIAGVEVQENVGRIKEAQFVVKDGQPMIQMPKAEVFQDINAQASTLVHAACHAHLYTDAVERAGRATKAGHTDEVAEARVAMYKEPPAQRAKSPEFSNAELAATHAAVNRTTAMPAEYTPPASAQNEKTREQWAQTLEARGGMSAVSRDVTTVERGFSADRDEGQRGRARERRAEREKERLAERGQGVQAHAGPADKPITPGGDPSVRNPPSRGGGPGGGQTQTQTRGKDDEKPAR